MSEDVYVLGVDMIKFGRFPHRTIDALGAEAARDTDKETRA